MDQEALLATGLLDGMSDDEIDATAALFESSRHLMGDTLTNEDEFGYSFFVVLEGQVRVDSGDETLAVLGRGDYFGEVALVGGERRNATVTAMESCQLAKLMTWDFAKLMEEHPALAAKINEAAEARKGGSGDA